MSVELWVGRYVRLQQELAIARQAQPWHQGRIARLSVDVAAAARELDTLQAGSGSGRRSPNRDAAPWSAARAPRRGG
jgi:hypothetical protein